MADVNVVAPIYTESDEIVSFDDIVTIQGRIKGDGNYVIPITPRQLISALRSGKVVRVITSPSNGGTEGNCIYVTSGSITSCMYYNGLFTFTSTFSDLTGLFTASSIDSFFATGGTVPVEPDDGGEEPTINM